MNRNNFIASSAICGFYKLRLEYLFNFIIPDSHRIVISSGEDKAQASKFQAKLKNKKCICCDTMQIIVSSINFCAKTSRRLLIPIDRDTFQVFRAIFKRFDENRIIRIFELDKISPTVITRRSCGREKLESKFSDWNLIVDRKFFKDISFVENYLQYWES